MGDRTCGCDACTIKHLTAERDALARWKAEAMPVLAEWDEVYVALGEPGALGESKARASRAEAARLREALGQIAAMPLPDAYHLAHLARTAIAPPPGEPTDG